MLESLHLENFRCFDDHQVCFRSTTLIVGRNNAGKSTIIEALRLVSLITNRRGTTNFRNAPTWTGLASTVRGLAPSLDQMGFDFRTVFHRYSPPPAQIRARFTSGAYVNIYIGSQQQIFATIHLSDQTTAKTKVQASSADIPDVAALPQIGPLTDEERILDSDYVRKSMSSGRTSRHFRNQVRLLYSHYDNFRTLAEASWPTLQLQGLHSKDNLRGDVLELHIRDGAFVGEVSTMGHGLQMWLQTMWFLARAPANSVIILDEPDVYMHPDLQRRLIQVTTRRHLQVIVATHSIEIMAEVAPSDILIVDKHKPKSDFANSLADVQATIDRIGGISNIQLVRLWSAKRLLIVEGEDIHILRHFHRTLFPDGGILDDIPNIATSGWGNWGHAIGSSVLLRNSGGETILPYCIFDSDYHLDDEIRKRYKEAQERHIKLHVWRRKELENYLLDAGVVARTISELTHLPITTEDVETKVRHQLEVILTQLREQTEMSCVDTLSAARKGWQPSTLMAQARKFLNLHWTTPLGGLERVPGKAALSELSRWSNLNYGVRFGPQELARRFRASEIPTEVAQVLKAIESGSSFPALDAHHSFGWLGSHVGENKGAPPGDLRRGRPS